ncbi:MAG TPA: SGNH/GDSL hydrolase family protein [Bryobacteraceae bacterium]|nr:SGNH/GDSL hydrolase family protein [Bryobacteraceae bacterium]
MNGRVRQALLNLTLLAFTVAVFAGFLEVALRVAFAHSLDFSMEMWKYAVALKQPVDDPRLSFVHRPNRSAFLMGVPFAINSAGLRDREFQREKPAGVRRIVWLGDSTTVGWGVPLEGTAPKILERELDAAGGRFEVLNCGVGNYDTVQEVEQYLTIDRAFQPDQVILEYFINDAEPVPHERHAGVAGHSYLAAFAISRFDGALRLAGMRPQWRDYYSALYRDGSPGFEAAKEALGRLADATARDGAGLLVAILPELHQINGTYPFEAEQAKVKDYLAARKIRTLDLLPCLRGHGPESGLWVTPADAHPNAKANTLIAACVKDNVRADEHP